VLLVDCLSDQIALVNLRAVVLALVGIVTLAPWWLRWLVSVRGPDDQR
jgi:hypothetical protein